MEESALSYHGLNEFGSVGVICGRSMDSTDIYIMLMDLIDGIQ